MLISINNDLSVQMYPNPDNTQWICYEPLPQSDDRKRRPWKRVTGLMSTSGMHSWLQDNHPEDAAVFQAISKN